MEEKLGCFLGTFLGLKGKGKGPFINLLGKPCDMISSQSFPIFWGDGFPPQALIYVSISYQVEETSEDLFVSPYYSS